MDSMTLETSSSSFMPTLPTATPRHRTFFSWNLMVDLTSVTLLFRSSPWETGVGNLPARRRKTSQLRQRIARRTLPHTLGETGTEETGNLLDQRLGSQEGIVLASQLLDELLVLVQLLQVVGGHAVDAVVLGTIEIVLVTKNTVKCNGQPSHSIVFNQPMVAPRQSHPFFEIRRRRGI